MKLAYSDMPLDRCTNQRTNKRWLKAEFSHENTLFCIIKEGMGLFNKENIVTPVYLNLEQLTSVNLDSCIYLGKDETSQNTSINGSMFAIDFDKLHYSIQEALDGNGQWLDLRKATPNLSAEDASVLAMAKGLVYWHKNHQFCGCCGEANRAIEAGHARRCPNCRNMTFPRTDPAVIMLVEKMFEDGIPRCLLGRQAKWDKGVYSTLAGFVDPGETLESAVIREVAEEAGLVVKNPQYCTSQPWPFPASVMLGFTAEAVSDQIDVSHDALEEALWFTREELSQFGINKVTSPDAKFKMSSADSISRYLITAWLDKRIGQY